MKIKPGVLIMMALILFAGVYSFGKTGKSVLKTWQLYHQKTTEEAMLKEAESRMDKLKLERDRLKNDPTYIEEIARKVYGMKKKDEEVFVITTSDSTDKEVK